MLDDVKPKQWVTVFAAVANKSWLRITETLTKGRLECRENLGRINLSEPAISYHLARLKRTGVLVKEKGGQRNCYHSNSHIRSLTKIPTQEEKR